MVCLNDLYCPDSGKNAGRQAPLSVFLSLICRSPWVFYLNTETTKFSAVTAGVCGRVSDVSLVLTPTKVEENLAYTAVLDA